MTSYQNPGALNPVRLGGAGRFSLAGQSQLIAISSPGGLAFRAAVACASVVRSLFKKSRPLPFDCYEQPFGDYPNTQCFLRPSHEDQLSDGEPICFSPNLKSSASVHGRRP